MSLKLRSLTLVAFTIALAGFTFGQDTKTTDPTAPTAVQKPQRPERPFGKMGRFGDPRGKFGRKGFAGRGMEFRGLNLTDAQKEQLKSIRQANKPDKAVMDELRTIGEARRSGTITDAQKARVKEIREQGMANAKSVHEQMLAVLTAEQKAQLEQRRTEMKQRMDNMRKRFEERRKDRTQPPAAKPAAPADPIN